ncbi:ATP-binding cassette domain-containing protein [Oerskovia sp. Sa1BUA8]|uniref:ATP-binding cassette domain-containing protein n=1 Tax=Oerskovia douganii TaxID=2762210 RepID=A0A9D5U826_9CELL|nr:ATP-binding cassette domain-containing protein [Oerskovia douganii]MBE7699509.1 ATP-binding cassette domain-containing protein [Oerskovia douganii]
MSDPMIDVRGLTRSYGDHAVLRGVDLSVRRGEIFALLGPNGAGKTTAVNVLTTLVRPDAGTVTIAGHDVVRQAARVREVIALTGQYASVDEFQTGEENLAMMATLAHLPRSTVKARTAALLDRFDLTDAARRRVETYSGGMRRRVDLAISLVANPQVLILDEPTTGLDPQSRSELWDVVRELAADGITVLLTTQYLEEADRLADTIAVLDGGRVVARGTASELKALVPGQHVRVDVEDSHALASVQKIGLEISGIDEKDLAATIPTTEPLRTVRDVLARADEQGIPVTGVSVVKPSLDDVFLALTGSRTARTAGPRRSTPTTPSAPTQPAASPATTKAGLR